MIREETFDETYSFYDQGQSENRSVLPTAEDVFVSLMQHPHFQLYVGVGGFRGEQLRAIYGIAELARKEAANQRRQQEGMAESENEATERVQRLCQALRSARRRVRSLTKTLREFNDRGLGLELEEATAFARSQEARRSRRPAAPTTPVPTRGTTPEVG